ncbi:MAG: hypothetical protein AABY13_03420 [Nanoarchaeota archaeon]
MRGETTEISDVVGVEVSVLDRVDNEVYRGVINDNGREVAFVAELRGYNPANGTAQHCSVLEIPAVTGEDRKQYGALIRARLQQNQPRYPVGQTDFEDWCTGNHGHAD